MALLAELLISMKTQNDKYAAATVLGFLSHTEEQESARNFNCGFPFRSFPFRSRSRFLPDR